MTLKWIGSELVVSNDNIQKIVSELVGRTLNIIDYSDEYTEIHNAFTAYTVMLLFAATGHRPVYDPFCFRSDYSLKLGMMLIEDKVISDRHRYRLVALPEIALIQLENYEKHLKWLVSKLIVDPTSNGLEHGIMQALDKNTPRSKHTLPLFFLLKKNSDCIKTLSISESSLSKYWSEIWPLPYNHSRHNIATQLRLMTYRGQTPCLTIESIEVHLGHLEGIKHPFGQTSVLSPIDHRKRISKPLHELLVKQGWTPLITKHQFRKIDHLHAIAWKHGSDSLGPIDRENKRRSRQLNDTAIVTSALSKYSDDDLIKSPSVIDLIREQIIIDSDNDKERINARLILLWKELIKKRSRQPDFKLPRRLHIIDSEQSPFDADSIISYTEACNIRKSFIIHLESQGSQLSKNSNKRIKYYSRVSEILISAALFDHISNEEILKEISLSDLRLTREAGITYMDVNKTDNKKERHLIWRWLPQPLSIALVDGLDSGNVRNSRMSYFNNKIFLKDLGELLSTLGATNITQDNAYSRLAQIAQSYWIMHTPSFLRDIASGKTPTYPLTEQSLIRILRKERLAYDKPAFTDGDKHNEPTTLTYALLANDCSNHTANGKLFLDELKQLIADSEKLTGENNKSANYVRKEDLSKKLHDRLSRSHNYPSIGVAIGSWCIKLCEKGTDLYGPIAFSTVKGYTYIIANALVGIASRHNFFNLSPDQYDYIYEVSVEINKHRDQTKLLNNLMDFHRFLTAAGLTPQIDWSHISQSAYLKHKAGNIDANIITSTEYLTALELIFNAGEDGKIDKRLSMQYCGLLILGYHFGLRISEAFHLQYRHIQHDEDWTCIIVHVRNTLFGDTKSSAGIRQVPLIDNLTSLEQSIVRAIFDLQVTTNQDEQAMIFSIGDRPRTLINKTEASQALNNILKQVTGDPDSHYHLLRHSFNSRVYLQFFEINGQPIKNYIDKLSAPYSADGPKARKLLTGKESLSSKVLSALSLSTGHSQINTTFSHYIHTSDHHLHYIASLPAMWDCFDFSSVDHITSYAHFLSYETTKKRRNRDSICPDNLRGALEATTRHIKFSPSAIRTVPHPLHEELEMDNHTTQKMITLTDIDKILLLLCKLPRCNEEIISERLFLNVDDTAEIIKLFTSKKASLGYTGYIDTTKLPNTTADHHVPQTTETIALHNFLPELEAKIGQLDQANISTLTKGVKAWETAYYPHNRYRPLVFSSPNEVIDFISFLEIINLRSNDIIVTAPESTGTWYTLDTDSSELEINIDNKSTIFNLGHASIASNIPLPLSRSRVTNKERISLSIDKNSKSHIAYQRRLHRTIFLLSIYIDWRRF